MNQRVRLCSHCAGVVTQIYPLRRLTPADGCFTVMCSFCRRFRMGGDYEILSEEERKERNMPPWETTT